MTDRAGSSLLRVGGAHQFAVLQNRIFAFEHLDHDGAGDHEGNEILEEGTILMNFVEAFGFSLGELTHLGSHDLEARVFETGVDLADHILGDGIGLHDGKSTLNSHF